MSLDGPNGGSGPDADRGRFGGGPDGTGGYQAQDQRPPATFRAGGAATYRQVPGPHPRRAFRTHPTGLASALRWSGERHGDHEIAECAVAVTGDRPRSLALPTTRKG